MAYQFTIRFIQYIQNPTNKVKPIVAISENLQETLEHFQNDQTNFNSLPVKIQDAETLCLSDLIIVPTKILLKPGFVPWKNAKELVEITKKLADKEMNNFFQKGKTEILRLTGFKEALILDNMKTSEVGYNLIGKFEKYEPKLYSTDGGGNCTIGYGHLIRKGICISEDYAKYPNGLSLAEAEAFLKTDVEIVEAVMRRRVTVQLTQNQFDALASFIFTSGDFPPILLKKLNARDFVNVPAEMKDVIYSNGKLAPGLVVRREEETQLFSSK